MRRCQNLGNFFYRKDVLSKYDPEVIRFFMLCSLQKPINYSMELIDQAQKGLERLYNTVNSTYYYLKTQPVQTKSPGLTIELEPYKENIYKGNGRRF